MRRPPRHVVPLAVAALGLTLAACGGSSSSSGTPAKGHVDVIDNNFKPATIEISVGDTVTWDWKGSAVHNVTFANKDLGGSATQGKGKTFTHTFNTAGSFDYTCTIHTGMKGTVKVS